MVTIMDWLKVFVGRAAAVRPGLRWLVALVPIALLPARAASLPGGFTETQVATGLAAPTAMAFAPDGRIFVAEQPGRLRVVKSGALLSTPFLTVPVNSSGERGLLGVAFDPAFNSNHFIYVYYTATTPAVHNRISRFTANGDTAASGSERVLLDLPNLGATNHNGGALHFGPDGKLYIAVGENAVPANAQSLGTPFGKLLRINSDGSIPTNNPFYGSATGINRAIWAYGLRNPFTFSFDRSNGTLFINDVGQNTWEEVNEGVAGANYGWPTTEGPTSDSRFVSPFFSYTHQGGGCSIVGSTFYRPTTAQFPAAYVGKYFFGDYCGGDIRQLDPASGVAVGFATGISSLVDLQVADDGTLYYLARGGGSNTGVLVKVRFSQAPSISAQPQNQTAAVGATVSFSVTASGSPPLRYQWQRNDVAIAGATSASYSFVASAGDNNSTYRVVVSNASGSTTSNRATLTVTSSNPNAPVASLSSPASGALYSGGDVISYAGSATDAEDGSLPASAFKWEVVFHHDTHTHPFLGPISGVRSGSFTVPTSGETASNVFYRIHLTVTDSGGRATEVTRDVSPRTSNVTLATSPAGLQLTLDGQPVTAPYTFNGVVGIVRTIGAVTPQSAGGQTYTFQRWSDGGAATHPISTPVANTSYTAVFASGSTPGPLVMEAESLSRTSSGATAGTEQDSSASGGAWALLLADGVGDSIQFTTGIIEAGTYDFRLKYKAFAERARVAVQIDGSALGVEVDEYSSGTRYPEVLVGRVTFATSASHSIRLGVTGRNAASTSYKVSADRFSFTAASGSTSTVYQAENATIGAGHVATDHSGYTGSGFVDTDMTASAYVEWTVSVPSAGDYLLAFRYANGSAGDRPADVRINGALVQSALSFPAGGSWATWKTVSVTKPLKSGNNIIRLSARVGDGTANLDSLTVGN